MILFYYTYLRERQFLSEERYLAAPSLDTKVEFNLFANIQDKVAHRDLPGDKNDFRCSFAYYGNNIYITNPKVSEQKKRGV